MAGVKATGCFAQCNMRAKEIANAALAPRRKIKGQIPVEAVKKVSLLYPYAGMEPDIGELIPTIQNENERERTVALVFPYWIKKGELDKAWTVGRLVRNQEKQTAYYATVVRAYRDRGDLWQAVQQIACIWVEEARNQLLDEIFPQLTDPKMIRYANWAYLPPKGL